MLPAVVAGCSCDIRLHSLDCITLVYYYTIEARAAGGGSEMTGIERDNETHLETSRNSRREKGEKPQKLQHPYNSCV